MTGYSVSTVGLDEHRVRRYIRVQEKLGSGQGELELEVELWNHAFWAWSITILVSWRWHDHTHSLQPDPRKCWKLRYCGITGCRHRILV